MKGTYYKVDGTKEEIANVKKLTLEELQKMIEGFIEQITFESKINGKTKKRSVFVNELGMIKKLKNNPFSDEITLNSHWNGQIFVGNIIVCDGVLK